MLGSHSMVQSTRTIVSLPWSTLVKVMMPCFALLTSVIVAHKLVRMLPMETGSSRMELVFPVQIAGGTFTEPEVRVWYN